MMIFNGFQRRLRCPSLQLSLLLISLHLGFHRETAASEEQPIVASERPVYKFSPADEELLDQIQKGCFQYLWREAGVPSGLAKDRRTTIVSSLGGVGFQLSGLPIGVERSWITREEGRERALSILHTITGRNDNRRHGVYLHFVHADTGALYPLYRNEASTVDHSLLLAGALVAGSYFGGEVAELASKMALDTNWRAYARSDTGFISFAWKPEQNDMNGEGAFMPNEWHLATDEERLIYFLAVGSPTPAHAIAPEVYYRLQRTVERHVDMPPYVVSFNGALFTYFFSHSWINYREFGPDDPAKFGVEAPPVDWFENSRRATLAHRQRCIEAGEHFATLSADRWGLSPCMGLQRDAEHYLVQEVQPNLTNKDAWHEGTVAPYAAGSAIVFTPEESMAALRAFRELKRTDGSPLAWRDPAGGAYALVDSFNIDQQYASDDNLAIDVGPMLLAIENARTGLIWQLFMQHDVAKRAVDRLNFSRLVAKSP